MGLGFLDHPFDGNEDLVVEINEEQFMSLKELQKNLSKKQKEEMEIKKVFDKKSKSELVSNCSLAKALEKLG